MLCKVCGAQIPDDAQECEFCGTKVNEDASAAEETMIILKNKKIQKVMKFMMIMKEDVVNR